MKRRGLIGQKEYIMKKLLIAIFGEENAEKPANKAITYAVLGTAAALILAILVLIISSNSGVRRLSEYSLLETPAAAITASLSQMITERPQVL